MQAIDWDAILEPREPKYLYVQYCTVPGTGTVQYYRTRAGPGPGTGTVLQYPRVQNKPAQQGARVFHHKISRRSLFSLFYLIFII